MTRAPRHDDTIAAIATAPGRAGIGIVRVSGEAATAIAQALCGTIPAPRRALLCNFLDARGEPLDSGLALYFPGPASFTGENVLELHGHGGLVLQMVLARVVELGARVAEPGEFTRRAFLNDKLDLAQAEAVADLIDSESTAAARAALRSLQGEFSREVQALTEVTTTTRMFVEAAIDFPEEEIDFLADTQLQSLLHHAIALCTDILRRTSQGALLRDGLTLVIAGRPNAGKSSLLNRLAGYDAAIVTDIPGTTRDVLREHIQVDGLPIHIADTAGLREQADPIEAEGIRRAHEEMQRADRILYVVDASRGLTVEQIRDELESLPSIPATVVVNKIDLAREESRLEVGDPPRLYVSAATGAGLELLREHLKECVGYQGAQAGTLSARRRHLDALRRAQAHLQEAQRQLAERRAGELIAEELRQTQIALGEITGEVTSEDLLGRIFSSFCIGK